MLFGDVARKFSTYLASMAGLSGVSNPSVFSPGYVGNQDPLSAGSNLMLSDKLTIQPSVSIFFSYARDSELSKQLDTEGSNITVFAPTNRAVMALPHKPHNGPVPVDDTVISQEEFDTQSRENVKRWVSAHIVSQRVDDFRPPMTLNTLLPGVSVSFARKPDDHIVEGKPEWANIVLNEKIGIADKIEAANGVLYLVDGAIYG